MQATCQNLEVVSLPFVFAYEFDRARVVLDYCLDGLVALVKAELCADANPALSAQFLHEAKSDAYALGWRLFSISSDVPLMFKKHSVLEAAFRDGQYDAWLDHYDPDDIV